MNFKIALAAAAVVGLAGTAQAADLAKKAPAAADYVKVCDAYGAGFFYIPGSETCLKIGGYVRVEVRTGGHSANLPAPGIGLGSARNENMLNTRARVDLTFDARTNTELGLLRSFIELRTTNNSLGTGINGVDMYAGFIQFAGLTAGRASSMFDFVQGGYNYGFIEPDAVDHRVNLLAYTFAFGNGISATLSVEDETTTDGVSFLRGPYSAVKVPHLVANVAIAQAWGRAQVMAALHQNYALTDDKFGYAVGAGVEVNLPMLGAGDKLFLQGVYTKGAIGYAFNTLGGLAFATDFGLNVLGNVVQSSAWSVAGGFHHDFSKALELNLGASYAKYDDAFLAGNDFRQYIVGADLRWKPVSGLAIGLGLDYRNVDYNVRGVANGDQWVLMTRIQRTF